MKRLAFLGRLGAVTLVVVFGGCLAEDLYPPTAASEAEPPLDAATRELIDKIVTEKYAARMGFEYSELFECKDNKQLRALMARVPTAVELQIAWELLRQTIPDKETASSRPVEAVYLKLFAGLLERRLDVALPAWWKETLLSAGSHRRKNVGFAIPEKQGLGFRVKNAPELVRDGDRAILTVDGHTVSLPQEVVDEFEKRGTTSISAEFNENDAYVAVYYDGICSPHKLFCIDQKTGKARWATDVWATPQCLIIQGSLDPNRHHMVSISVVDRRVIVFGTSFECIYVEAFDAANGAALCRFSTNY